MQKTTNGDGDSYGDEIQKPVELSVGDVGDSQMAELIKNFILPDGTDYGLTEAAYDAKERNARKQIASGSLRIIFDAASDTTMLMSSQDWRNLSRQ